VTLTIDGRISKRIFEALGFKEEGSDANLGLRPPTVDVHIPEGRMNRRKLLRAWVEIGAWVVDFKRVHSEFVKFI
jgi:ubiquitin carboxyl-terminal hydrolase 25